MGEFIKLLVQDTRLKAGLCCSIRHSVGWVYVPAKQDMALGD